MKTPITYYGGKLNMLKHILPLIPQHKIYVEPFFGGGAVFFAKRPSESEIINDSNAMVINFYKVLAADFEKLKQKIEATLFARATYVVADTIYRMPHLFSHLQQAWAFYIATNMGFSAKIGSWGYDKYGKRVKAFLNKKLQFDRNVADRILNAQIECNDACKVITSRDSEDTFHYIDPPYIETSQGHYAGYTEKEFKDLLETLTTVSGKFLMSSYPSEILDEYIKKNNWHTLVFKKPLSARKAETGSSRILKTEVLTSNYPIKIK
jgi:DNA adenine methylase